jgi:hypothetical protein
MFRNRGIGTVANKPLCKKGKTYASRECAETRVGAQRIECRIDINQWYPIGTFIEDLPQSTEGPFRPTKSTVVSL